MLYMSFKLFIIKRKDEEEERKCVSVFGNGKGTKNMIAL